MSRLDTILHSSGIAGKTFIKIDTQGFEHSVLRGAESWLRNQSNWILKMEFAPHWLKSQQTDPLELLSYLHSCGYEFAEFPERIPFGTPRMGLLFSHTIKPSEHQRFVEYVESLNKSNLGWVDLLVRPRKAWLSFRAR